MKNMKYLNLLKLQCMALLMLGGLFISSCTEDDMTVGTVDEKLYEFHDDLLGYLTDSQGKQLASNVEFRSSGDLLLYLNLTKKTTSDCAVSVVYDENVLEDYNVRNSASYELFPQSQVMLPEWRCRTSVDWMPRNIRPPNSWCNFSSSTVPMLIRSFLPDRELNT